MHLEGMEISKGHGAFFGWEHPQKKSRTNGFICKSLRIFGVIYLLKHHRHRVEGLPAALEGALSSKSGIQQVKMVDVQPTICFGLFLWVRGFCIGKLHLYTILFECCTFFLFLFWLTWILLDWFFGKNYQENTGALRKPWICFTPKHTSFLKTVLHSILGEMILAPHPPRHALPHAMIRFKGGDHHGPAGGGKSVNKNAWSKFHRQKWGIDMNFT